MKVANPPCECHGESMVWYRDARPGRGGGQFGCRVLNRERAREHMRKRRATPEGRTKSREAQRRYIARPEVRERKRLQTQAWRRANPDRQNAQSKVKKARKFGADYDGHTRQDTWDRWGGTCYLCGAELDAGNWHEEHIQPLSRGGSHTLANCRPACPPCNTRKGQMTLSEYLWRCITDITFEYAIGAIRETEGRSAA